jgi:glycosyltransferase involved in cell wall biosynthesis
MLIYTAAVRRVLLLNTDLELGGTPTVIRELAVRLRDAADAHVEVACLARQGPIGVQIEKAGIVVTPLNAAGAADLGVAWRLVHLIREHRIDTVFSFLVHANTIAALAAMACRNVRFFQAVQTTQPRPRWHWAVQAAAQYAAERVVAPSNSVANAARDWAGVPAEKIVVIPNAIDRVISTFSAAPGGSKRGLTGGFQLYQPKMDHPGEIVQIGFIGRLDPVKRIPDLLEAMENVHGAHLHVFGAGEQRPLLEQMIRDLNLADLATLRGPTAGPQEALAQIGLLVLPSQAEGFPLVLIEAMAAGVPIVATDAPGIRDVIINGRTGLLVPIGSPGKLAAAIQKLVDHPQQRRMLAIEGFADVQKRFTWKTVLPQYLRLLDLPPRHAVLP